MKPGKDPRTTLSRLSQEFPGMDTIVGLGPALLLFMGQPVPGLHAFPSMSGPGCNVVSTQADLWILIRNTDQGTITRQGRALETMLAGAFVCIRRLDCFKYAAGLDLTGYEDGTENPVGEEALAAAIVQNQEKGLHGSSFVSVQQWLHDLTHFHGMHQKAQDDIIGRRKSDNGEIEDAPHSAHVKRTAQESYNPPAFLVRRSMPWIDTSGEGLLFIAFSRSLNAFDAMLKRMTGQEDGIVDALFQFTRPVTGGHYWCPPVDAHGRLNLIAAGL